MKQLVLGVLLVTGCAKAADPKPLLGLWTLNQQLGYFEVTGSFDGSSYIYKFSCLRQAKICFESWAHLTDDKRYITVDSTLWDIDRWDATTLISRDELPACQANQLQVDFKAMSLVVFVQPKKATNDSLGLCKGTKAEAKELRYHTLSER
jgi:hypothetical protein